MRQRSARKFCESIVVGHHDCLQVYGLGRCELSAYLNAERRRLIRCVGANNLPLVSRHKDVNETEVLMWPRVNITQLKRSVAN